MASTDTLIDILNEILRATGQRANKTTIVETDDTAYIRDRINDALGNLYRLQPFNVDADGTISITPSTRTFSGPSGTDLNNIHDWSWRIDHSSGDVPVAKVTEELITTSCPDFETASGASPQYVYFTNGLIGVYPLLASGSTNLTLQFKYSTQFTKLTAATATFPFENRSDEMDFIKLCAQRDYEIFKGLGQSDYTNSKAIDLWGVIVAKYRKGKRIGFTGSRLYGR